MEAQEQPMEPYPLWDDFNIDIVVKVFSHTALSPFFVFFIPVFYFFQGFKVAAPRVWMPATYCVGLSLFWLLKWYSRLYRNQGNLLFGPPRLDWGEQIIVVTGGSSGVGELVANTLAVRNVTVVVLDIKPIVTENYNIVYYKCDVTNWEEVQAVHKQIVDDLGHPTILINNAGVVQGKLILDLTPEDVKQTFDVNTIAHFNTLRAFLPNMVKEKTGHVITMSSVLGLTGAAQVSDYAASKGALISLNDSLRYELDKHYDAPGVRTSLFVPGHILTPLFSRANYPSGRIFQFFFPSLHPVEVAKAVIRAIDDQHSQVVYMPFFCNFAPFVRSLPSFLRDFVQWITYADYTMKGFEKVTARRSEEGPVPPQTTALNGHAKEE